MGNLKIIMNTQEEQSLSVWQKFLSATSLGLYTGKKKFRCTIEVAQKVENHLDVPPSIDMYPNQNEKT